MTKRFYLLTCLMLLSAAGFASKSRYFCVASNEICFIVDPNTLFGLGLTPSAGADLQSVPVLTKAARGTSPHRPVSPFALLALKWKFSSFLWGQYSVCAVLSSRQFRSESACTTRIHAAVGGTNRQHGSLAFEFIQPTTTLPRDYASNFGAHSPPSPL